MRVSSRNRGLSCIASAFPALGLWGFTSAQGPASRAARASHNPDQHENGIQVHLCAGLNPPPATCALTHE